MILIGLGNPGTRYQKTRHNMGFVVLDRLAADNPWREDKSLRALIATNNTAVLIKPQTYMNASGTAVRGALKKYAFSALGAADFSDVFVVYDDLDLPVGKYKLVFGSGPKVHNGVNSVQDSLQSDAFWHVRIGVDGRNGDRSIAPEDYVLSQFSPDEQLLIDKVIDGVVDILGQKIAASDAR